jgi:uncharacterized protein YoxC
MFQLPLQIVKTTVKANGKLQIRGIASDTSVDRDEEMFMPEALSKMQSRIKKESIPLRVEHQGGWHMIAGNVTDAGITKDNKLMVEAEVDTGMSIGKDFAHTVKLAEKGQREMPGFSVAGKVIDAGYIYNKELNKNIRAYKDVSIDEISLVGHPSNKNVTLDVVSFGKSINLEALEKDKVCLESKAGENVRKNLTAIDNITQALENKLDNKAIKEEEEVSENRFNLPTFFKDELSKISEQPDKDKKVELLGNLITTLQKDTSIPSDEVTKLKKSLEKSISDDKSLSLTSYFNNIMSKKMIKPIQISKDTTLYSLENAPEDVKRLQKKSTVGFIAKTTNGVLDVTVLNQKEFNAEFEKTTVKKDEEKKSDEGEGGEGKEEEGSKEKDVEKSGETLSNPGLLTNRAQGRNAPRETISYTQPIGNAVKSELIGIDAEGKAAEYCKGIMDKGKELMLIVKEITALDKENSLEETVKLNTIMETLATGVPLMKGISEETFSEGEKEVAFSEVLKEVSGIEYPALDVLFAGVSSYLKGAIVNRIPVFFQEYAEKTLKLSTEDYKKEIEKAVKAIKEKDYEVTKFTAIVSLCDLEKFEETGEELTKKISELVKVLEVVKDEKPEEKKEEKEVEKNKFEDVVNRLVKTTDSSPEEGKEGGDKEEDKAPESTAKSVIVSSPELSEVSKTMEKVAGCLEKLDTKYEKANTEQSEMVGRVNNLEETVQKSVELLEKVAKANLGRKSYATNFKMLTKSTDSMTVAKTEVNAENLTFDQIFAKNCDNGYDVNKAYANSRKGILLEKKEI